MPPKKDIFQEYLKDGFDPANWTKTDLHRLLNRWFIDTDGAATKANLVDMFNDKIVPHKEDIIKMHAEQKERDDAKKAEEKAASGAGPSSSKTVSVVHVHTCVPWSLTYGEEVNSVDVGRIWFGIAGLSALGRPGLVAVDQRYCLPS